MDRVRVCPWGLRDLKIERLIEIYNFCLCQYICIFTNPSARAGYDTRSIFKRSLTGLNSEFSFSKAEEPSPPYYLPIAGGRIFGFIPFPRVLLLCEMQSVPAMIWTRVTESISYDDNHYTTGTSSANIYVCMKGPTLKFILSEHFTSVSGILLLFLELLNL